MKKREKYYGTMHPNNNEDLALQAYRILEPKGSRNSEIYRHFNRMIIHLAGDIYNNNSRNLEIDKNILYQFFKNEKYNYSKELIDKSWIIIYSAIKSNH